MTPDQPLAAMTPLPTPSLRARDLVFPLATVGLVLLVFGPTLVELGQYWAEHPEYSHGFLLPPIAAWMVWSRRHEIAASRASPSWVGAALLVPCLAVLLLGEMKLSWFLKPYAFVGGIAALTWAVWGRRTLRAVFLPLLVLFLMCPLPGRVQNALTLPLKNVAAVFAAGLLDVTGFQISLEGNLIRIPGVPDLWVADACSGIRSLISLVTLAILACMSWKRAWPLRAVVVVSAIPIAVLVNGLRIFATGVLASKFGTGTAEGFFHLFEGLLLFAVAGLFLWGWACLLTFFFPRRQT